MTIAPCLVAADGGGDRALAMGLTPKAVIGDLDSLSDAARASLGPRVHQVTEQDSTDFAKSLQRIEAPFILALGFTGMRLDHTLAAMTDLIRTPHRVVMLAEEEVIFRCPPSLSLDLAEGTRVSLFPFGEVKARSEGLHWPLDGIGFTPAERVGTSNRATGSVRIVMDGPALMMLPREEFAAALAGLGIG
ncbi:thiamine diphosphokinase [Thioclava nitratireducens]|uniref:thiamine diphosphokinase n=1 Tax=Thioclava nitratireducens TaxID=1915078 RepID=UPI001FCC8E3A|nr:thiamine diphosphokinase [Thioclava nitratireducens]WGT50930.1 thiamine diphosphokinase [Thioclava nitratireducens]